MKRRKAVWIGILTIVLIASILSFLVVLNRERDFAFVTKLHGWRTTDNDEVLSNVQLTAPDPFNLSVRFYRFEQDYAIVLAAMRKELLTFGWVELDGGTYRGQTKSQVLVQFTKGDDSFYVADVGEQYPGRTDVGLVQRLSKTDLFLLRVRQWFKH